MQDHYTVVIAGGGPAGLQCARTLSKSNIDCVVLEKSSVPGEPNNSTAGTPAETIEKFKLPDEVVTDYVNQATMLSPSVEARWKQESPYGFVMDFRKLKLFLAKDSVTCGAEVVYGAQVDDISKFDDGAVKNVTYTKDGIKHSVEGKYFLDATAAAGAIASKVCLRKKHICWPAVGIEKIIRTQDLTKDFDHCMRFYFGTTYIPHGYAWVFSFGNGTYKVGVCNHLLPWEHAKMVLEEYLTNFLKLLDIKNYESVEKHGNTVYVNGGFRNNVYKNTIMVGDAASTLNPFLAEGIRHALASGTMAAETIIDAHMHGNKSLSNYNRSLKNYRAGKWLPSFIIAMLTYHVFSDKTWDFVVNKMSRLSIGDAEKLARGYEYGKFLKTFF
jgi:digeranylgeranylglycerophospholipid reductase